MDIMMDTMLNFRVPSEIKEELEKLAQATGRSKTYLATEALQTYLAEQAWQVEDLKQALKEAEEGKFAPKEAVDAFFQKYGC